MRAASVILCAAVVTGCDREPIYAPTSVSPADLRAALPELKKSGSSMLRSDDGQTRIVPRSAQVEYPPEPPQAAESTSIVVLEAQCLPANVGHAHCPFDTRASHPRVLLENGAYYNPRWGSIAAGTLAVGLTGGVVGLEVYCFEKCGTGGKIALVSIDVASAVVVTFAAVALFSGMGHGLNN